MIPSHTIRCGAVILAALLCSSCSRESSPVETSEQKLDNRNEAAASPKETRFAKLPHQQSRATEMSPAQPTDWLELVEPTGFDFAYQDGSEAGYYQLLESVGGGVALFDFDRDGDLDVFVTGGGYFEEIPIQARGHRSALFRNDGDWNFVDITEQMGLAEAAFYSHGCTVGDVDADGWDDLFVCGFQGCRLFRNNAGSGFEDVTTKSKLQFDGWGVTGAFADVDRDGDLDLYLVTYADWKPDHTRECKNDQGMRDVCGPTKFPGSRDVLWRNRGDGTFEDISTQAGLVDRNRGLGIVCADVDDDGWIDLFVVNDVEENQLYLGGPELPFRSVGEIAGVAYSDSGEREGSMGVDVGDFNGDGLADLWYTNYAFQDNSLLQKVPGISYVNVTNVIGLRGTSRRWVGFGTALADLNSDGWQDIFIGNGHVVYERFDSPYYQPAQLFENQQGQQFAEITEKGGPFFSVPHSIRGTAVGDLDNDGGLDLVVVQQNDPVAMLRNRQPAKHWVRVLLQGKESNPNAVGAEVSAPFDGRTLTRWVRGGGGYCSYFDPRILFPQTDPQPVDVTVHWPSGQTEVFRQLEPMRTHKLTEGDGQHVDTSQ
ncbi:CRTAC1 family protein [Thalassoroseus pseudoceratinae]|uniref:CRTAC1 family protein n=1 Tax=Thalassoroseus pseudoceratinae TaxID=2713176 RepID=UPI0014217C92|nr:CRTAC1 family protein [Thalassoroseus pseudoceratinae]